MRFKGRWKRSMKQLLPPPGPGADPSRCSETLGCPPRSWTGRRDPTPASPYGEAPGQRGAE